MSPFRLILAIFACYRLARLVSTDDGPLWVFARLREFTDRKRKDEQDLLAASMSDGDLIRSGPWASLDDGLRCEYCTGVWFAPVCAWLAVREGWLADLLLAILGVAGAQAALRGFRYE